jgi:hypothetical protein
MRGASRSMIFPFDYSIYWCVESARRQRCKHYWCLEGAVYRATIFTIPIDPKEVNPKWADSTS